MSLSAPQLSDVRAKCVVLGQGVRVFFISGLVVSALLLTSCDNSRAPEEESVPELPTKVTGDGSSLDEIERALEGSTAVGEGDEAADDEFDPDEEDEFEGRDTGSFGFNDPPPPPPKAKPVPTARPHGPTGVTRGRSRGSDSSSGFMDQIDGAKGSLF
jgi:hypothetical protein